MLLVQDVQVVIGREELPFQDTYHTELAPRIADDAGAAFAGFLWLPHGGGEGYEAVTLTALDDVDALERHQERLTTGDLSDAWLSLQAKVRRQQSSLHLLADWSPIADGGLAGFTIGESPTSLFRLDAFSVDGSVSDAVDTIESQWRTPPADATTAIIGCWSPFLGELEEPVVHVCSRVTSDDALKTAFSKPAEPWIGTPELPGARRFTRLLRSVSWSPIH